MNKLLSKVVLMCPFVLGAVLLTATTTRAGEVTTQIADASHGADLGQVLQYSAEGQGEAQPTGAGVAQLNAQAGDQAEAQVTSVSQLSDVRPTDWAFQALQSLVERYGVIAGYPDGTFRGNRALTRYEFAAGLNAALDRVNELIAAGLADKVSREDLATLQRLQEEYSAELATLRGRVDGLEARTAELEANQFSTTTKLNAEAIFALSGFTGADETTRDGRGEERDTPIEDSNIIFTDRVRLNLDTSFSGQDRLRTRLQARNFTTFNADRTGTDVTRLGFDDNNENQIGLDTLIYRFPAFGTYVDARGRDQPRARISIGPNGTAADDVINTVNPYDSSGGGSISRFGQRNTLYRIGGTNAGVGFDFNITPRLNLSAFYGTRNSTIADPNENVEGNGGGFFGGTSAVTAQLTFRPFDSLDVAITYVNAYLDDGRLRVGTASRLAERIGQGQPTSVNAYGAEMAWRISPSITLTGWAGFVDANQKDTNGREGGSAQALTYAAYLGFADLIAEGDNLVLGFGQPLRLTNEVGTGLEGRGAEEDTSYLLEAFYRLRISDNVAITPGVLYLINPENNSDNGNILVGTIRTTFTF
ncbi:iron uptake porin [Leptolyngbya sp. FACHB-261]|uniref:iron uptake porin n=1 Tax=Leptolyngbya sp. FACHB-261 TaxID=2692806 RepID=UPI001685FB9C|nr:iron uptake porin [Leptolyngbya sp. FACHB-261]MBD2102927.1 iron uptake porin [Leptolyngbya sp. FACHB-261]